MVAATVVVTSVVVVRLPSEPLDGLPMHFVSASMAAVDLLLTFAQVE